MEKQIPFEQFIAENPDYLAISHSQIENFERCHRYWEYVSLKKLAIETTWPMRFSGDMLHPAFSRWYKTGGKAKLNSVEWQLYWDKYMLAVANIPCPKSKALIYSREHARQIVQQYIEQYDKDFVMYEFLESEERRYRVLPGLKVVYLSIPDLVLKRIGDDKIVVNDFKHSTWRINVGLDSFHRQLLGQAFVTGAEFLMKTNIYSDIKTTRDTGAIASCEITRPFDPVEPDQMSEWIDEVCQTAEEMQHAIAKGVFVKHSPKGCFQFNKECEFKQLCSLGSARNYMIDTMPKRERN